MISLAIASVKSLSKNFLRRCNMAREYIQTAKGVFTPIADTQGALVPMPVRYTRFRPSDLVLDGSSADSNYYIAPTPAQCAAGGGETWNSGSNRFYVPKGGIYTVSFPAYRMSALVDQPTQFARSNNGEWKSFKVAASGSADLSTWKAADISLLVPEGGYIQIGYNAALNTTLQFEGENSVGMFLIYLNEVSAPYIVANKGALVSSDASGKIKIDAGDGTMSVNGGYSTAEVDTGEKWYDGRAIYKRTYIVSPGVSLAPGASVELGSSGGVNAVVRFEVIIDGVSLQMFSMTPYNGVYTITNRGSTPTGGEVSPWIVTVWGCK
jgi:hypothetical protein